MDRKDHFAWAFLTRPGLTPAQLLVHFRHEYWTYVRDFPVLLARVMAQGPPPEARVALAANIFEEQTGGLSLGRPHPDLFLEMVEGVGIPRAAIEEKPRDLVPEAIRYRAFLDRASAAPPWVVGAAVLTIFVEGSVHERDELAGKRKLPPIEEAVARHPLVRFYGCPPERMRLARAHRMVEPGHRQDAWQMVLANATGKAVAAAVGRRMEECLRHWLAYRDGVARAMGIRRPARR
jgi:pyrroloquinoline-quinone synthase